MGKLPFNNVKKAYKVMKELGFPDRIVKEAVKKLLKVYGEDSWSLIEDDDYKVLYEYILSEQTEKNGEGPSGVKKKKTAAHSKPVTSETPAKRLHSGQEEEPSSVNKKKAAVHPKPVISETPAKRLRSEQEEGSSCNKKKKSQLQSQRIMPETPASKLCPVQEDKRVPNVASSRELGFVLTHSSRSDPEEEEDDEPQLIRRHRRKGSSQRDREEIAKIGFVLDTNDSTLACTGRELVKSESYPAPVQIHVESGSFDGESSKRNFLVGEKEQPNEQERGLVIHQLAEHGDPLQQSRLVYTRRNRAPDSHNDVPLAAFLPGFLGQSTENGSLICNSSVIEGDKMGLIERADEIVLDKKDDISGSSSPDIALSSSLDIALSSNGEVKIALLCNSPRLSQVQATKFDAAIKKVEEKFVESRIVNPSFSLITMLREVCECFLDVNGNPATDGNIPSRNDLPIVDPSAKPFLPKATNKEFTMSKDLDDSLLQIPIHVSLNGVDDISRGEENKKIPLVTGSSTENKPTFFYTSQSLIHDKIPVKTTLFDISDKDCCSECIGNCLLSTMPCACAKKFGAFAYTAEGLLDEVFLEECIAMKPGSKTVNVFYCGVCPLEKTGVEPKTCKGHFVRRFIKECWSKCRCSKRCGNRVVQRGITANLQVFPTKEGTGWGLQTVGELPKGSFVCEYVGEILTDAELHSCYAQNAARRGGSAGNKFRMSLGLPVAATVNCADNTGAKNLYIISVKGIKGRLNRLPSACVGDMVMATVKKGKPDLRKKVLPAVIVRQRKPWRRKDGVFMYFEDNAGVIVNPKGEMKGSAITGPIGKECADLWPRIASAANAIV
ncbi:hypothetical protein ACFE04_008837 [Oxalis oulophora]